MQCFYGRFCSSSLHCPRVRQLVGSHRVRQLVGSHRVRQLVGSHRVRQLVGSPRKLVGSHRGHRDRLERSLLVLESSLLVLKGSLLVLERSLLVPVDSHLALQRNQTEPGDNPQEHLAGAFLVVEHDLVDDNLGAEGHEAEHSHLEDTLSYNLEDMLEFTARTNKRLANDLPKTKVQVLGVMRRNPVLAATDPGIADLLGSKIWLSLQESDVSAWPSVEHAKLPGSSAALACTLVLYTPTRQPLVVQRTGALREDLRASRSADLDAALACLNRIPEIEEILPAMGATPCVTPSWMARRLHSATGLFSAAARLTAHSCFSARHRMWTVRERAGVGQPSRLPNAALSHAYAYIQAASTVVHVLQSRAGGTGHSALEAGGGTYTAQRINGGPTACSSNSAPAEKGVRTGPSARAAEGHVDTGTAGEGASGDAVLRTLIDVLLGLVFGLVLWWHREEAARLVHAAGAWWSWMPEHLRWLMGAPAGLKVHRGLATLLAASSCRAYPTVWVPWQVFLLYLGAAALFRQQRKGMRWSWMLIRPPSVAVAPTLGVAADLPSESILIERLIIGVLIYTPLILLLPTMGIFYASMWAAWFIMLGSQVTLHLIL
eukprot:gene6110-7335_t